MFESRQYARALTMIIGLRRSPAITQHRIRIPDHVEGGSKLRPAIRGTRRIIQRTFVWQPRQPGAREGGAQRVPACAGTVMLMAPPYEPCQQQPDPYRGESAHHGHVLP